MSFDNAVSHRITLCACLMKSLLSFLFLPIPLFAKGPPNDNLADAKIVAGDLPKVVQGSLTDRLDRFRATKEEGEPNHAGLEGHGSVWFSWTPEKSQRVEVSTFSAKMSSILAVYTGESMSDLTLVHRYQNFAFPAFSKQGQEPFTVCARVEFDAQAGTRYLFVVDTGDPLFKPFFLKISESRNPLKPILELFEPGSRWEYLLANTGKNEGMNPKFFDDDFFHTWMFPERYDGPEFSSGLAPIGFGKVNSLKYRSFFLGRRDKPNIENGERYTSYLRTTFTPILDVTAIGVEGVFDDGAIIYLNGKEVLRMNVSPEKDPQDWKTLANGSLFGEQLSTESNIQYGIIQNIKLPANTPVKLSLSLHNAQPDSLDLGIDLRLFALGHSED